MDSGCCKIISVASVIMGGGAKSTLLFNMQDQLCFRILPSGNFEMIFEMILLLGKSGLLNHCQILRLLHRFKVEACGYIAQCSDSMIAACRTGYT